MEQALKVNKEKLEGWNAKYSHVVTKSSVIRALSDAERQALWEQTVERLEQLPANAKDQIEKRMKENPKAVKVNSRQKVGTAWTYKFYINNFECELEVKEFLSEKYEDEAKFYAFNPYDSQCYIRNLLEL
jgi:hypothetical protein